MFVSLRRLNRQGAFRESPALQLRLESLLIGRPLGPRLELRFAADQGTTRFSPDATRTVTAFPSTTTR